MHHQLQDEEDNALETDIGISNNTKKLKQILKNMEVDEREIKEEKKVIKNYRKEVTFVIYEVKKMKRSQ